MDTFPEGLKAPSILPYNEEDGIKIGETLFIKKKVSNLDTPKQRSAIYIYDNFVKELSFEDSGIDYSNDLIEIIEDDILEIGDVILFFEVPGYELPSPLREDVSYFVVGVFFNRFQISETKDGEPIDLTSPEGGGAGTIKSNAFGKISLRETIPDNAVITRTWIEKLELDQGSGSASGSGSGSAPPPDPKISFGVESDFDILDPTPQSELDGVISGIVFTEGKQDGKVTNFIKTRDEREITMTVQEEVLEKGDYMVVVEFTESQ